MPQQKAGTRVETMGRTNNSPTAGQGVADAGSGVSLPRNVYALIAAVSAELAQTGISKNRENQQQHYSFRGIDDVYNALAPVLARHGLVILPRMVSRACVERTTQKGGVLFYTTVEAEFEFVSAHDGSRHTVRTYGEAMDSGDKSTNKAMSAAYKYAAMQTFCIPTEGDNDTDATTHDGIAPKDDGYSDFLADMEIVAQEQGYEPLVAAINKAAEAHRTKLRADGRNWSRLKQMAEAADKSRKEAA